jgi:hypothetical protein
MNQKKGKGSEEMSEDVQRKKKKAEVTGMDLQVYKPEFLILLPYTPPPSFRPIMFFPLQVI